MPVDPRSALGQTIGAGEGICFDPKELSIKAGQELARRVEAGATCAEAVVGFLVETAKYTDKDIIALDEKRLFDTNPHIADAVSRLMSEAGLTRGQAITHLLSEGAKTTEPKKTTEYKRSDPIRDVMEGIFGRKGGLFGDDLLR